MLYVTIFVSVDKGDGGDDVMWCDYYKPMVDTPNPLDITHGFVGMCFSRSLMLSFL